MKVHKFLVAYFVASSSALTYWIDKSCSRDHSLDEAIEDAKDMAKAGKVKIDSNDKEMQWSFRIIMKTDLSDDAARTKVGSMLPSSVMV